MSRRPAFSTPLFCFIVVSLVHLGAQLFGGDNLAATSQMVVMPTLAWLLLARGSSTPLPVLQWALTALFFSWLGDSLPRFAEGDTGFRLMIGSFLFAQVSYVVALWRFRSRSVLHRPILVAPYVVACVALLLLLAPDAGSLWPAVVIYALALTATGVLSTGLGLLAGCGGALFMLSDSLIAFRAFGDHALPGHAFWVMLTYLVAQLFLVVGVINARQSDTASPVASPRSQRP